MTAPNAPTEPVPVNPTNLPPMPATVTGVSTMMVVPVSIAVLRPVEGSAVRQRQFLDRIERGIERLC